MVGGDVVADLLEGLKLFDKNFRLRLEIEDLARNWKELYPTLTIREQLILAHNWCIGNPLKAPKSQWIRFLNSWMKQAHEWSKKFPKKNTPYVEAVPPEDEVFDAEDFKRLREALKRK